MAAREGKVFVYCIDCDYHSGERCFHPENMNLHHWKHPIPRRGPDVINAKNDCKWFVKPKWYRAFGWGTRI